jgi:hypothetical membrane protein
LTGSIVSGRRRGSKQRYRRLLNSIVRGPSASYHDSGVSLGLRISYTLNRGGLLSKLLTLCGVVAPIVLIALIFVGAAVTSGYNHFSDPISQLAATGSPYPGWLTTGFITYGIMILGFGFVLYRSVREHRLAWLVFLFYVLHGVGFLLGGIFSDDPRTAEAVSTASGILHNVWIIIGCSSFVGGMFVFAWLKRHDPTWRLLARIFIVFLAIILLAFAVSQIPALAPAEGLLQRVYGFLGIVLIEIAAIQLLVTPTRQHVDSGEPLHL